MTPSIVIHKSAFGLALIYGVGFLLAAALIIAAFYATSLDLRKIYGLGAILTVFGTFVQTWAYLRSTVVIDANELRVNSWSTLFSSNVAVTEWKNIQDADVVKGGIFSQIGDFGTLLISTASGERNIRLTLVPQVEHWRDFIEARADAAVTNVKETP
jgi:hypothetical protein